MSLFDWTFTFFHDNWEETIAITTAFCIGNLLISTFMRMAFAGRIRLKLQYKGGIS